MNNNIVKDISLTTDEREKNIVVLISIILFIFCFTIAVAILPERCSLFSDNIIGGLQCDALTIPYVPCGCQDRRMASVATVIAGLGIGLLLLPLFVHAIRNWRKRSNEETKLFD